MQLELELAATARGDDPLAEFPALDDTDRRYFLDLELRREVRPLVDRHADDLERFVVPPPLQDLGDEALHAAAATRLR